MTLAELEERLTYWQAKLRLQDWRIELRLVSWHEIGIGADAHVEWNDFQHDAEIIIIDEAHYFAPRFGRRQAYDAEFYILHELLHLRLLPWLPDDNTPEGQAQELAINHLAGALLELDRRPSPSSTALPATGDFPEYEG